MTAYSTPEVSAAAATESARTLLALDGGNSKTDVLLVREDGTVLARQRSGPFIPHLVGPERAVDLLAPDIELVLASAPGGRVNLIAGYLANADLPIEEELIASAIASHGWSDAVLVENDTLAMLRTGTSAGHGVAAVCGAGINCVGVGENGERVRFPALGRITGDWGGGIGIAKEVLWYTSRAHDGRGPATSLSHAVAEHFGLPHAAAVAEGMHLRTIDYDRMHEIVPLLLREANAGDPIARSIVHRQAQEVALLVTNALERLRLTDGHSGGGARRRNARVRRATAGGRGDRDHPGRGPRRAHRRRQGPPHPRLRAAWARGTSGPGGRGCRPGRAQRTPSRHALFKNPRNDWSLTTMAERLRMGVAGTGYWASVTHAPAVVASAHWDLAAVWGRNPDAAAALAQAMPGEVSAFADFDDFLDAVDAVTFALPPDVQAPLALRAINAGKHVLLEKPISLDAHQADEMVAAADRTGVATAVFFTMLYDPRIRAIIASAASSPALLGGTGLWLGSALNDDNPFNTPWRHVHGGLWDLGPHALSVLWTTVGPIVDVAAHAGDKDLRHLVLTHASGATSTVSMTLRAPDAADGFSTTLWGEQGRVVVPVDDVDSLAALTRRSRRARRGRGCRPHRSPVRRRALAATSCDCSRAPSARWPRPSERRNRDDALARGGLPLARRRRGGRARRCAARPRSDHVPGRDVAREHRHGNLLSCRPV